MPIRSAEVLVAAALLVVFFFVGCASDPGSAPATDPIDVTKGDASRFVCPASIGEAFTGYLDRLPSGAEATLDNLDGRMWGVELQLEAGEGVGVWVRGLTGSLDPEVVVKGPSNETLGDSYRQSIVIPVGLEEDAAVAFTAQEAGRYFLLASPWAFDSAGEFRLDTFPLSASAVDLVANSPGTHAVADSLRERETEVAAELLAGTIREGDDGRLIDERNAALRERARIGGLVDSVNDGRENLARQHLMVAGRAEDPALVDDVVRAIGEIGVAAQGADDAAAVYMDECN